MKVLIIGGAGMIGRKLAERLAKDGEVAGKAIYKLTLYDVVPGAAPAGAKMPVEHRDRRSAGGGRGRQAARRQARR